MPHGWDGCPGTRPTDSQCAISLPQQPPRGLCLNTPLPFYCRTLPPPCLPTSPDTVGVWVPSEIWLVGPPESHRAPCRAVTRKARCRGCSVFPRVPRCPPSCDPGHFFLLHEIWTPAPGAGRSPASSCHSNFSTKPVCHKGRLTQLRDYFLYVSAHFCPLPDSLMRFCPHWDFLSYGFSPHVPRSFANTLSITSDTGTRAWGVVTDAPALA